MVEAAVAHRRHVTQPALHLISDGQRGEQRTAVRLRQFRGREHGGDVVGWMTGLARREIAVIEIEVADERAVQEGRSIRRTLSTANERTGAIAAEIRDELANMAHRIATERADGAT